ncbi:hypothetical protein VN97_g782 [Penicillium thymicola]|uniref:Secreted protein n=1 Tax=Penicillium thymicola TaxID=293382 RepID=A0AAI9XCN2_PENTH|nr:hypothetical protein VN97_g782 [Penicillium thymicola]
MAYIHNFFFVFNLFLLNTDGTSDTSNAEISLPRHDFCPALIGVQYKIDSDAFRSSYSVICSASLALRCIFKFNPIFHYNPSIAPSKPREP